MFVMVQPSQRRLDQGTCESPLDNSLIVLGEGGTFPFIYLFGCVGGVLVGDCSRLSQVGADWTRSICWVYWTTTLMVLRGQFPIKYLDFWKSGEKSSSRGGGSGVYSFEECIIFVQF